MPKDHYDFKIMLLLINITMLISKFKRQKGHKKDCEYIKFLLKMRFNILMEVFKKTSLKWRTVAMPLLEKIERD